MTIAYEAPVSRLTDRSLPALGTMSHLSLVLKYDGENAAEMVNEPESSDAALGLSHAGAVPLLAVTSDMPIEPPKPKNVLTATVEPSGLMLWQPAQANMPPMPGIDVGVSLPASRTRTVASVVFQ